MIPFQLSDPGSPATQATPMAEYLRSYNLPQPPDARYGFTRLSSSGDGHRVTLFGQAWVPGHALGTVFFLPGYSEHCGNYARLISEFVANEFAVLTMDLRGHGLSEGPAGHADSPHAYAEDAETMASALFPLLLPHRPLFLWAHSLGALTGLQLLLRGRLPVKPSAAVFTSPLLGFPDLEGMQKLLAGVAPLLGKILPTFPIAHGIAPAKLSHDEEYLARRFEDPLIRKVTTPRWFSSAKQAVKEVQEHAAEFAGLAPVLLMLAGDEKITNLNEARKFAFQAYAGPRHKVIEFPGSYHELEKEPAVRDRVMSESLAWFRSHGQPG